MSERAFHRGVLWLGAGLLASSLSSLVESWSLFGASSSFVMGLLDGLAVVAFGVGLYLSIRQSRSQ